MSKWSELIVRPIRMSYADLHQWKVIQVR